MNIMQCSLHPIKFSRVSSCASAKEIWNRLMVIYESMSEVKETKANMLHTKATVVEESRNLSTTSVDELIGSLMTYELGLKRAEEDVKKKMPLALKASLSIKEATTKSKASTSEDDSDEFALITRKFKKFLRKEGKGFLKKKSRVVCYNCKNPGHVKSECLEALKKTQPRWMKNKQKAMVGTWSEEEDDDDEESLEAEESQTKICLMARGEEGDEEEELCIA
ncbi:hypothetical protein Taro_041113 [Colocasia esculenta]|uniref:CCHC-type domain-containing protein n=1 Tax=Colocasia esculenta TaxID=4460 RepID=A0A843WNV9_COLES|nr:hypothetical protein [Colocasia esculenta]